VHHLRNLFFQRHARDQIVNSLLNRQRRVAEGRIRDFRRNLRNVWLLICVLGEGASREQYQQKQNSFHA